MRLKTNKNPKAMKEALIIIDIQNDYFDGGANPLTGSHEASLQARALLNRFRERSLPVVHVRHISTRPCSTFFLPGTVGSEIHPSVAPAEGEKVVEKHFPNSFRETDLEAHLRSLGVTDLVVCGMMTHMCVSATTRAAKDLGFSCTLASDACATKTLEWAGVKVPAATVQTTMLATLSYFYADVKTTAEYLASIDN